MRRSSQSALLGAILSLGAFLGAVPAARADTSPEEVGAACLAETNLTDAICACVAEKSADLTEDQRGFYVASFTTDQAETTRLRTSMPPADLIGITTFIRTSVVDCAKGQ